MSEEPKFRVRVTENDYLDRVWIPMSPQEIKHIANMYACIAINQQYPDFFNDIVNKMNLAYEQWCEKKGKDIGEEKKPDAEE